MRKYLTRICDVVAKPFRVFGFLRWLMLGLFALCFVWFLAVIAGAFGKSAHPQSPIASICALLIVGIIALFAFYVYKHGGILSLIGGAKFDADKTKKDSPIIAISYSEIAETLPADKWVVSEIRGVLTASIKEARYGIFSKFFKDVEYKLARPINVLYRYYIPLTDLRFNALYDREKNSLSINAPALKFDNHSIAIEDLSQFNIVSENFQFFISNRQKQNLPAALKQIIQEKYIQNGISDVNMTLATAEAKKVLWEHLSNLLWTHGAALDTSCDVKFTWISDVPTLPSDAPKAPHLLDARDSEVEIDS